MASATNRESNECVAILFVNLGAGMLSLRSEKKRTAISLWSGVGWAICGCVAIAVTLVAMGRWPAGGGGMTPVAMPAGTQGSGAVASVRTGAGGVQRSLAQPASAATNGVDVLARLETAAGSGHAVQSETNTSNTLNEALQRAFSYPDFTALAGRSDPEGLVEAAAWADACAGGMLAAQEQLLRCGDAKLHEARYAEDMLKKAADAGQPAAVLALAQRYPAQWLEIPLPGGDMLGDRVFALAARGHPAALAMLSQLCAVEGACVEPQLTRNVLALLQLSIYKTGTSDVSQYLTGPESERRAAADRAAQLRARLNWPA